MGLEAVDLASAARRLVDCRRSWPEPDSLRLRRLLVLVESCEAMARRLAKAGPLQSERAARDARALLRLVTLFLQDHRPGSGQPKLD